MKKVCFILLCVSLIHSIDSVPIKAQDTSVEEDSFDIHNAPLKSDKLFLRNSYRMIDPGSTSAFVYLQHATDIDAKGQLIQHPLYSTLRVKEAYLTGSSGFHFRTPENFKPEWMRSITIVDTFSARGSSHDVGLFIDTIPPFKGTQISFTTNSNGDHVFVGTVALDSDDFIAGTNFSVYCTWCGIYDYSHYGDYGPIPFKAAPGEQIDSVTQTTDLTITTLPREWSPSIQSSCTFEMENQMSSNVLSNFPLEYESIICAENR